MVTRRFLALLAATLLGGLSMNATVAAEPGVVRIDSHHSVNETAQRLEALLKDHGIHIFAHLDFTADAARAGLTMRPLKALIWEDADGRVTIAYNDPQYVLRRHGLPAALSANIAGVIPLLQRAAQE
jgi:uncharacterized protein (DUF302 family)